MMKTFKTKLLTIAMLLCSISASAHDFEVDGIYYNILSSEDLTVEVTYRGLYYNFYDDEYTGFVVIPESVTYNGKNYSVTSIGDDAFYSCNGLTSVTIGNSVTSIGDEAFSCCDGLTSVTIPNSVTSIGDYAFYSCFRLKTVINFSNLSISRKSFSNGYVAYYADKVINADEQIGNFFFKTSNNVHYLNGYIGNDKELTLPENYKGKDYKIGEDAFYDCDSLETVTIPNSVTSIGDQAFYSCNGLTSVTIPNSVTSIGYKAFYSCNGLTSVTIGNSVTSIGDEAFWNCDGLTSVTIPNSVTSIGYKAFYYCDGLTSVTIPNSVTSIGDYAFGDCDKLTNLTYEAETLDLWIWDRTVLRTLTIGAGVTSITGGYYGLEQPQKTIWLTNTPPKGYYYAEGTINYVANDQYSSLSNVHVYPYLSSMFEVDGVTYVPVDMGERTCDVINGQYTDAVSNLNIASTVSFKGVSMTVKEVMPYSFYGNDNIKELTISNLGNIGENAFERCSSLRTVSLSDNVSGLEAKSFANCDSLQEIVIPGSMEKIDDYCFYNCSSLERITIGENVGTIGVGAFSGCSALTEITIPQATKTIENSVFDGCSALTDVIIEDRTEALSLGSNGYSPLFESCPLDSVYIGGKITYSTSSDAGYSPFYRNTSLRSIVISNNEEAIYDNEFYGCTGLKNVSIGHGVKTIGDWAFSGCSGLDYFAFGGSVESIGKEAFSDCTNVTQIISHAVVPPTCGTQALDDINKWNCTLKVPESYKEAYMAADQWKDFFFVEDVVPVQKYTLTYKVDGEVYHTESIAMNGAIVPVEIPAKEGHTFSGWSEVPETMPASDVTIEGSFSINTYTITYMVDGEVYATEQITYGSAIILKDAPAKEGYIFSGWSEAPETMPAGDVTVEGSFTVDGIESVISNGLVDVYTLQGVMVKRQIPIESLEQELPDGIYIINGKKMLIR